MKRPHKRSIAGLRRILNDPDTAVQVVSFTRGNGAEEPTFGAMRPGVDYWPRQPIRDDAETVGFVNTPGVIALMWPGSWTYQSDDDGNAVIATRQNRPDGDRLVIRLHQPEVLAANWSASLTPDRIEER